MSSWQNYKKPIEWNEVYTEKSQMKTNTDAHREDKEVKVR